MQRIAIDYTPAYEQSAGIGRYVRELCAALARLETGRQYRLFVAGAARADLPPAPAPNFCWSPCRLTPRWLAQIWQRARLPLPVETFTGRVALYHATDFVLPPTLPGTRALLTVHDLSFARVPESADPALKAYLDAAVPRSVALADHILADSEATKADLIALYGTAADKVTVLYSGVDERFRPVDSSAVIAAARGKYGLGARDYLLSVGTLQPRKNYSRAIAALSQARARGIDIDYAIAGGAGWLEGEMRATIARTDMSHRVHLLGFVADEDLPALYSGATAMLMPSLYEGFGLPVLEAMACGTPVVTSSVSSLPEVAGDAALLVDPHNVDEIAGAIEAICKRDGARQALIEAGFKRAARFTWARSAAQLNSIYEWMLSE